MTIADVIAEMKEQVAQLRGFAEGIPSGPSTMEWLDDAELLQEYVALLEDATLDAPTVHLADLKENGETVVGGRAFERWTHETSDEVLFPGRHVRVHHLKWAPDTEWRPTEVNVSASIYTPAAALTLADDLRLAVQLAREMDAEVGITEEATNHDA